MSLALSEDDLPAAFAVADRAATHGRDEAKRLVRWELRLAVLAAASGLASWRVGGGRLDVWSGVGTIGFLGAAILGLVRAKRQPEQRWYRGRAAAESAKTLAIRYAVGGDPFPVDQDQPAAEARFIDRLQQVVELLATLELPPVAAGRAQLTDGLRALRHGSFEDRRRVYGRDRLEQQWNWYSNRAAEHSTSAKRWTAITIAANVAGVVGGGARFFGVLDVDALGLIAAVAATGTAWSQLLQHRTLATSYGLAALELGLVVARLPGTSDPDWALFVSDAEDAISREHTLWLARRGHPGRPA